MRLKPRWPKAARSTPSQSERVSCTHVADLLPSVDRTEMMELPERRHVEQCLRCQAELVGYRRMRRLLASLAEHPVPADAAFDAGILIPVVHDSGRRVLSLPARAAAAAASLPARAATAATSAVSLPARAAAAILGGVAGAAGVIAIAARRRRIIAYSVGSFPRSWLRPVLRPVATRLATGFGAP